MNIYLVEPVPVPGKRDLYQFEDTQGVQHIVGAPILKCRALAVQAFYHDCVHPSTITNKIPLVEICFNCPIARHYRNLIPAITRDEVLKQMKIPSPYEEMVEVQ